MRAKVSDLETLRSLKPLELVQYLRFKGWRQESEIGAKATLWVQGNGSAEEEIILPKRQGFADFDYRMAEILQILSKTEDRSQLEILRDIETTSSDIIRLRAPAQDSADGSVALDIAVSFVESARDLMLAAACAALDKRNNFATRKQQATDYIDHVRMGQTERGSFILTILSPVPPALRSEQGVLFDIEPPEPFQRTVTRTLARSLNAMSAAAEAAAAQGDMKPFIDAVQIGVSANLCEAVVRMSRASLDRGFDFNISWAASRSLASDTPSRVKLQGDAIPIIEEAARLFREITPVDDFELQGVVVGLSRPKGAPTGKITVAGFVESQTRIVQIDLTEPDYSVAISAHKDRAIVTCTGELSKSGTLFRLLNPRQFRRIFE